LRELFLPVLKLGQRAGLVKLGHVALDGTKAAGNASKRKAKKAAPPGGRGEPHRLGRAGTGGRRAEARTFGGHRRCETRRHDPRGCHRAGRGARTPFPAWDLLGDAFPHRFGPSIFNYPCTPIATVVTSRGCPFSCSFCDRSTSGKLGRYHSTEYVLEMCRELAARGTKHVLFYDDLFTVKKKRVVALCEGLIRAELPFSWSCNSHPNLLDLDTMRLMKRAGCKVSGRGRAGPGADHEVHALSRHTGLPDHPGAWRLHRGLGADERQELD
jgi:hypothetical protein